MIAEFVTTTGLALEIVTAIFPGNFLVLASTGNFVRAVGKGLQKPVFRVIQNHFAATGNVGSVAAKEEVWEVCSQLVGYALSVVVLQQLEKANIDSWEPLVGFWVVIQALHVALRYRALSVLRFTYINRKRAALLALDHVRGRALEGPDSLIEPLLAPASSVGVAATLGCSIEDAWLGLTPHPQEVQDVLQQYAGEAYALVWQQPSRHAYVLLKPDAGGRDLLRALWQAAWLTHHGTQGMTARDAAQRSLAALSQEFEGFVEEARQKGWDVDIVRMTLGPQRLTTRS